MTDLAIVQNAALNVYDVAMSGPDLLQDQGLKTAVILSLLLDRVALPGDVLPDPQSTNRRGWWGDAYLPPLAGRPDFMGSRLWLLKRAIQNNATLIAAQGYALEALNWMLVDGVVGSLSVVCTYPAGGQMQIAVTLGQQGCDGVFNIPWSFST